MIIVAVTFLVAGISSCLLSGMRIGSLGSSFGKGVVGILPAVLMILMASSIKYTLEEACVLDTILHEAVLLAETLPAWTVILFVYLIVLVMNFFISSGSAKAFMLIPLIMPIAQIFGISPQLCILAFALVTVSPMCSIPPMRLCSLALDWWMSATENGLSGAGSSKC